MPDVRSMIAPKAMEDFLVAIHFGKQDLLTSCVRLAYRDLQRTVRGIARFDKREIPGRVRELLVDASRTATLSEFDHWHHSACDEVIAAFKAIGYPNFTVGHAQKWFNMALKYVFVLGDRVSGFNHLYLYCHVPLDQFVIKEAAKKGFPALPGTGAWSTLNDYQIYMDRQRWFRENFVSAPLVTEFRLWLDYVDAMQGQSIRTESTQERVPLA